jgi:hypothetical protein
MNGGAISNNTGGGIYMHTNSTFTMTGGTISGNIAHMYGGGVYLSTNVVMNKTGGTIYGYSPSDPNSNRSATSGHAVHVQDGIHLKDTTVGPGDILRYNYPAKGDHYGW